MEHFYFLFLDSDITKQNIIQWHLTSHFDQLHTIMIYFIALLEKNAELIL